MPRVVVARPVGFCSGVERAIRVARQGRERFGRVWTLGELVHNPLVLKELAQEGIVPVNQVRAAVGGALVIRAHGCPPGVFEECRRFGVPVIDATCPYVRNVQRVARRLKDQGYGVVVVGERNHPEVRSILAHAGTGARCLSPDSVAGRIRLVRRRIGVVAQTTMAPDEFKEVVAKLAQVQYTELRVFDTICSEVKARQERAAQIAEKADVVIVVGGRSSANTCRLVEVVRRRGRRVMLVEEPDELRRTVNELRGVKVIGVIGGSSTPSWVVKGVAKIVCNSGGADEMRHRF
ncbi:MAG: 4-hydroxy-3-methylbut-2-enyl diphosphate reductase [candidate division WOR-3 bacterium]